MVKTTERGWIGHFICGDRCNFRRNTLIEGDNGIRLVVSTVGMMQDIHADQYSFQTVNTDTYYETMVGHAEWASDSETWEMNVRREIETVKHGNDINMHSNVLANKRHETIVEDYVQRLKKGHLI